MGQGIWVLGARVGAGVGRGEGWSGNRYYKAPSVVLLFHNNNGFDSFKH